MKFILVSLTLLSALNSSTVFAGADAEQLGRCLAENTSGKDRKNLARWMFVGMSAHPEIAALSSVKPGDRELADKAMAALFMRLITENCAGDARAAMQKEGTLGFQAAFGALGQLAMQELMSDKAVAGAMAAFERHVDQKKVTETLTSK